MPTLIIEGDNLLALKALLPTHAGKIKCIYIDSPYNPGNEDWVYNDNLTCRLICDQRKTTMPRINREHMKNAMDDAVDLRWTHIARRCGES